MANVAHSTLTTTNLHEPKGVSTALAGQVYIANGLGSGAWTTIEGLSLTGQIGYWATPVAPSGWLECNGADISIVTYAALYNAMTIQQTGTRNGTTVITGLTATNNIAPGYYVFGTGINSGTTVVSVESATQFTMSAAAVSSGTSTVIVSPYLLNTGTIRLPNLTGLGKYLRSRKSGLRIGQDLTSKNLSHTHGPGTLITGDAGNHSHNVTVNLSDPGHVHATQSSAATPIRIGQVSTGGTFAPILGAAGANIQADSAGSGISVSSAFTDTVLNHSHPVFGNTGTGNQDDTEARPETHVVLVCVKT